VILGEGIRLRPVEREDLSRYVAWFNDPEVREGIERLLPMSSDEEGSWFQCLSSRSLFERPFALDVLEARAWRHIGGRGIHHFELVHRNAELGIVIGETDCWHRGFGRAATQTHLSYSFDALNPNRAYLHVLSFNERAIRLCRGLGFRGEGPLRQDCFHLGRYHDTLIMGLLREEWAESAAGV
jgi:RimJ/RimL family protein N-acetyltransferase